MCRHHSIIQIFWKKNKSAAVGPRSHHANCYTSFLRLSFGATSPITTIGERCTSAKHCELRRMPDDEGTQSGQLANVTLTAKPPGSFSQMQYCGQIHRYKYLELPFGSPIDTLSKKSIFKCIVNKKNVLKTFFLKRQINICTNPS